MKIHPENNWFHASEFLRAAQAIHDARGKLNFMTVGMWRSKYVQLYIDQRTGSFTIRDHDGVKLTTDEVYSMYPSLADDVEAPPGAIK